MGIFDFFSGGDDAPAAPDPFALSREQARANRVDQITPFGSLRFRGPDRSKAVLKFTPEIAKQFRRQAQLSNQVLSEALRREGRLARGKLPTEIDDSGFIQVPGSLDELRQFGADAEQATFDRGLALLQPGLDDQERALRQRLADQGLVETDEAGARMLEQFGDRRGQLLENLALSSVMAGQQEESRQLAALESLRNQQIADALRDIQLQAGSRQTEFNELAALAGLQQTQAPGLSSFFAPSNVDVLGSHGLSLGQQNVGFQADAAAGQAALGGLFDIGSAFLMGGL